MSAILHRHALIVPLVLASTLGQAGCRNCQNDLTTWRMTHDIQCAPPEHPLQGKLELILVDDEGNVDLFKALGVAAHAAGDVELGTDPPMHLGGREVHPYYLIAEDPDAIAEFMEDARVQVDEDHRVALERLVDPMTGAEEWKTWYLVGDPVITEADVLKAEPSITSFDQRPVVTVELTDEGGKRFGEFTGAHVDHRVAILLDGEVMSAPIIIERIDGGRIQVTLGDAGPFEDAWCQARALASALTGPEN